MASVWTTPHCGAVVKDKYIPLHRRHPLHLLLHSRSPQHPHWFGDRRQRQPPQKTDELEKPTVIIIASPLPFFVAFKFILGQKTVI